MLQRNLRALLGIPKHTVPPGWVSPPPRAASYVISHAQIGEEGRAEGSEDGGQQREGEAVLGPRSARVEGNMAKEELSSENSVG